jgi:bifunctional enzyme CysN/CysC
MTVENTPLRTVFVGHVDHGKSTLVGRLFYDTDSLEEGKYEEIRETCKQRGVPFEWAFLMDALQAERNQKVTIDTSQIWFDTDKRPYVIIDAPGHKEFLKNMITGAASADAAVLLIAADEGVQEQSRRHGYMLSMLGIDQVAVVVNKMDLVDYDEQVFDEIVGEYGEFLNEIGIQPDIFLPVSAKEGDNVIGTPTENMPWYDGPNVVETLDAFETPTLPEDAPLRFAVQDIYKFDERRIVAGRVESGRVEVGENIVFTPNQKSAVVESIERWSAPSRDFAKAGESVGLMLTEQLFIERGHIASPDPDKHPDATPNTQPSETKRFHANVFWMGKDSLELGESYKLKLATQEVECTVAEIVRVMDGATLELDDKEREAIGRYDVAEVVIETKHKVAVDPHDVNQSLGRFVLVDDYDVSGGGIVLDVEEQEPANIFWQEGRVSRQDREKLNNHKGACVWLTGLSGAGKSSVAIELESKLHRRGIHTYVLDGDNVRHGLCSDLGFSPSDRDENIRRVGEVANLMVDAGTLVIAAFISPYRRVRDRVRDTIEDGRFVETHVKAPVDVCEERDPKGLYEKARTGEIENFTGVSAPYEEPENPELVIDTVEDQNAGESAKHIIEFLESNELLTTDRTIKEFNLKN